MGAGDDFMVIEQTATEAAREAGAIVECPMHPGTYYDPDDLDARKKAFAIGTNIYKESHIPCDRDEFLAAIKRVIDQTPQRCPDCDKLDQA